MDSSMNRDAQSTLQPLDRAEAQSVDGGLYLGVDVTGMPSRDVMCGTMWIFNRVLDTFRPRSY